MKIIDFLLGHSEQDVYNYRVLEEEDMAQMHRTFSESFSDYAVPYNLTLDEFRRKMKFKINLDYTTSMGAFSNQKLVAFIFHSINHYEGSLMAYNAGTGVVPGHRGNCLPIEIYERCLPLLSKAGVDYSVLEVLEQNKRAIKVYQQVGFERTKTFSCFQMKNEMQCKGVTWEVKSVEGKLENYEGIGNYNTSFGDTNNQLLHNIRNETTLEASVEGELAGYLIMQSQLGRITQFAVKEDFRGRGAGRALFQKASQIAKKDLLVINVNQDYQDIFGFLKSLGFARSLDQLEMQLPIK